MDIVDIAVEELQFEYSLFDSFFNEFPEPAMEEGFVASDSDAKPVENKSADASKSSTDDSTSTSSDDKPKMYDVNKHRDYDDKADFMSKIESFFKMVFEMITRAINNIKAKFTRAVSGQKTFAKEMEKLQKNKKPNFELKCKNYLYNDSVINKLYTVLDKIYNANAKGCTVMFNAFQKVKDDPEGLNNLGVPTITENGNITTVPLTEAVKSDGETMRTYITLIASTLGIKGEMSGEGDFFDAVRRMFRGSVDPVEFQLKAKPDEFNKAFDFIKNYEKTVKIYMDKLDETKKDWSRYQTIIGRFKNADIPKSEGRTAFNKMMSQSTKGVTFICSCYTFIVSLMQERLLNCRNLIRRAYGKI